MHLIRDLAPAKAKALKVDWKDPINRPAKPKVMGNKTLLEFPISDVVEYIDWNPFFQVGTGQSGSLCRRGSSSHRGLTPSFHSVF